MIKQDLEHGASVTFVYNLTLLFIALKLTDNIDWNWLFVLAPIIIPVGYTFLLSFINGFKKGFKVNK